MLVERPPEAEAAPDLHAAMVNRIVDLERELKRLKKELAAKEIQEKIEEDDVDQLRYIYEELQNMWSQLQSRTS